MTTPDTGETPTQWCEKLLYDALLKSCPRALKPPIHEQLQRLSEKRWTELGMGDENLKILWTEINAGLKAAGYAQVAKAGQAKCKTVGDCLKAIMAIVVKP